MAATDGAGLVDGGIEIVLNPEPETDPQPGENHVDLPKRPADSAARGAWAEYVVALGADPDFIDNETEHHVGDVDSDEVAVEPPFTKAELIDLADRLGG